MQQINLYKALPKRRHDFLSSTHGLQACVLLTVILLIAYGVYQWQTHKLRLHAETLRAQQTAKAMSLAKATERYPLETQKQFIEQKVRDLRREMKGKHVLVKYIENTSTGITNGFSPYLIALAKQIPNDTWLSTIRVKNGKQIHLTGHAIHSSSVALFIKQLSTENVFSNTKFDVLQLTRSPQGKDFFDFTLSDEG